MGDMKKCMCLNCFNIKAIETYKVKKKAMLSDIIYIYKLDL